MSLGVAQLYSPPYPCACNCFEALTLEERAQGILAMFRFEDAMRGWAYQPIYEPASAHRLFQEAKERNDPHYRQVAVRDEACVYRRLVGFAVHELIHALSGDVDKANYGIPFGAPYGVPVDLAPGSEAAFLHPFNQSEARAWVGVQPLAKALYGIEWPLRTARDVGTYGFIGGNAMVNVPAGFRPVPHIDRQISPERYYAFARKLEDEARIWFTEERIAKLVARVRATEAIGRARRKDIYPSPLELAAHEPRFPDRNQLCLCGSGKKWKRCCADSAAA